MIDSPSVFRTSAYMFTQVVDLKIEYTVRRIKAVMLAGMALTPGKKNKKKIKSKQC